MEVPRSENGKTCDFLPVHVLFVKSEARLVHLVELLAVFGLITMFQLDRQTDSPHIVMSLKFVSTSLNWEDLWRN